ncbi:MAG: GC-type dockerin domain-anchored protein [Planctomycetota bacterium]|jgi:hypothetical protein
MRKKNVYGKWIAAGGAAVAVVLIGINVQTGLAYPRYTDGCQLCHGDFDDATSPKGTMFPSNSKHEMHRGNQNMNTDCGLCHIQQGDSPLMNESAGTANNPGVGCVGCHGRDYGGDVGNSGVGLRLHHFVNDVTECVGCHGFGPDPLPENILPTYYGTVDTNADDSCNEGPGFLENWSVGDTDGLDNDGDNLYDGNDPDCAGAPPCPCDCNSPPDGVVNTQDFLAMLAQWGGSGSCDCANPPDGVVNTTDFLALLAAWGDCP